MSYSFYDLGTADLAAQELPASYPANIRLRLRARTLLFRYFTIVNIVVGCWYMVWRLGFSLNWAAVWLSVPLALAELYSYCGGVIFLVGMWRPLERANKSLKHLSPPLPIWPTVDIFITCYNEPPAMVEATAAAALAMDYPPHLLKVYVLDDGASPAMQAMTTALCERDLTQNNLVVSTLKCQYDSICQQISALEALLPYLNEGCHRYHMQISVKADPSLAIATAAFWFDHLPPASAPYWSETRAHLCQALEHMIQQPVHTAIETEVITLSEVFVVRLWTAEPTAALRLPVTTGTFHDTYRHCNYFIVQRTAELPYLLSDLEQWLTYLPSQIEDGSLERQANLTFQRLKQTAARHKQQLSDFTRCRYIARPKLPGRPHHAKAGNINYAIFAGGTTGEFIVTLDADHIPKPQFLQRVLPYFFDYDIARGSYYESNIAFVQTPQDFTNIPKNDPFGHKAHLFYGPIQQGKDGLNAAFYTGTNAILRREALVSMGLRNFAADFRKDNQRLTEFDLIGGVSSISITEDMNTAMRLHAAGWQSVYHDELLAEGLAPDDLGSTFKQKLRWAQGTLQVFLRDNPLLKSGLSFWQKWQYFQTMYSYFSGFATLIFLLCPIVFFFTGYIPVSANGSDFALHFIPTFIINRLTLLVIAWGIPWRELWRSEQYAIAQFPLFIRAVITVFGGRPLTFQVTAKQRVGGTYLRLVWPQVAIVVLSVVGVLWTGWLALQGRLTDFWVYSINSGWVVYNCLLLLSVVRAAVWQPPEE